MCYKNTIVLQKVQHCCNSITKILIGFNVLDVDMIISWYWNLLLHFYSNRTWLQLHRNSRSRAQCFCALCAVHWVYHSGRPLQPWVSVVSPSLLTNKKGAKNHFFIEWPKVNTIVLQKVQHCFNSITKILIGFNVADVDMIMSWIWECNLEDWNSQALLGQSTSTLDI